jgi:valyl-tRNA synthetase
MERSGVDPWLPESLEAYALPEGAAVEDRWIFSRLNETAAQANKAIGQYRYHEVAQVLWHFFWHEFCDWYLELKKLRLAENSGLTADWRNILAAFETALRLLHPAMPFLTEELWTRLRPEGRDRPISVSLCAYPQFRSELADAAAEREIAALQEIVTLARTLRTEMKIDPKQPLEGALYSRGEALAIGARHCEAILKLANVKLAFRAEEAPKVSAMRSTPEFDLVLNVPAAQLEAQRKRLEKEKEQLEKNIASSQRQLGDEKFLDRAPAHVVESIRGKLADYQGQLEKVKAALEAE